MKKFIISILTLVLGMTQLSAQSLTIGNIELPQGGKVDVPVKFETGGRVIVGCKFKINTPEGISYEKNALGVLKCSLGDYADFFTPQGDKNGNFALNPSSAESQLPDESGTWFTFTITDDANSELETTYTVTADNVSMTENAGTADVPNAQTITLPNIEFTVTIVENVTILDENSTTAPEPATGVKVKVQRTIKGGNWSTICLPFAMSEAQVAEAFGAGVELADFQGYDYDEDANSITVNFSSISSIAANHPCIIKVSSDISEFGLEDVVDIDPVDAPEINKGDKRNYKKIVGTYVADFDFYSESKSLPLFLSGNKFWYASESTRPMKAFRAYFDFKDEIDTEAGVKIQLDGIVTDIQGIQFVKTNGAVFTIDGKKMNSDVTRLPKGVYVIDGKKVAIK